MDTKKKQSNWKMIALVLLLVQLLLGVITISVVIWVGIIPAVYIVLLALIFVWLATVVYYFFFTGLKNKKLPKDMKTKRLYTKRGIGCAISALVMIGCIVATSMLAKAGETLHQLTNKIIVTDTTAVYVRKDDPANSTLDAKDYLFAITENMDYKNTLTTIDKINEETGVKIKTKSYETIFDMADALMKKEVGAMILNVAYVDILESKKAYKDFSSKTKTLFSHDIETVVEKEVQRVDKKVEEEAFVVYIAGSDTRSSKLSSNTRSDVNILAVINPNIHQVLLINTPRDYYIDISVSPGAKDKLTHCGVYGIDCSMKSLGTLYDVPVDYYAKINFNGFETLIDAIGGITIESEKSFMTYKDNYYIAKGTNQLDGKRALSYVRERQAFADGDNARGRHQMQMIKAIADKATSGTTILTNYSAILESLEGTFMTNMSADEMAQLVKKQLKEMPNWNIKSFSVNGNGSKQHVYSMPGMKTYVTVPDETTVSYAKLLIDKTLDGVVLTEEDMIQPTYTAN